MNTHKLALGTAQFGLDYGVSNNNGQVDKLEVTRILKLAIESKILMLDTAIAYGNSESILGQHDLHAFQIISKLGEYPAPGNIHKWAYDSLTGTLNRLKQKRIRGLLLHRPHQLLERDGAALYSTLQKLKGEGLIEKIGISVYGPTEAIELLKHFDLDIIQIPFNIFDQRILQSGFLQNTKKRNVEIHTRSVFLQGLLLLGKNEFPQQFHPWRNIWHNFQEWLSNEKISSLEACVRSALSINEIDKIIVGVASSRQLKQLIDTAQKPSLPIPSHLSSNDVFLINPTNWSKA